MWEESRACPLRLTSASRRFMRADDGREGDAGRGVRREMDRRRWDTQWIVDKESPFNGLCIQWKMLFNDELADMKVLDRELNALKHIARQFLGDTTLCGEDMIEGAALALLQVFSGGCEVVTAWDVDRLTTLFGPVGKAQTMAALDAVRDIKRHVSDAEFKRAMSTVPPLRGKRRARNNSRGHVSIEQAIKTGFGKKLESNMPSTSNMEDFWCGINDEMRPMQPQMNAISLQPVQVEMPSVNGDTQIEQGFGLASLMALLSKDFSDTETMFHTIIQLLQTTRSNEDLQMDFIDLVGTSGGAFEIVSNCLQNRDRLIQEYAGCLAPTAAQPVKSKRGLCISNAQQMAPVHGQQITVLSETEKHYAKMIRKGEKKLQKLQKGGIESAWNDYGTIEDLRQNELASEMAQSGPLPYQLRALQEAANPRRVRYPNVYDALAEVQKLGATVCNTKILLPEGFRRIDMRNFEEISIPPSNPPPTGVGSQLIAIKDLDELAQKAFANTKSLNRIQSMVFETAYRSAENLLICAPTGAGKTNIAMLTVLRVIKDHTENGHIRKADFKIVYVAPMKALAAEMVRNFGGRLQCLGLQVKELTGDMQLTKSEIMQTQMLITTPEKWDVVTRKAVGDVSLTHLVKLLIIDEVHLLHDERGSVIETLVARTQRQVEMQQNTIRILGLSATLPNYVDVARFLGVDPYKGLFFFDGRFRPVPLAQTFIGVKSSGGSFAQAQEMDVVCYEKVSEFVKQGHQVLCFVHARTATGKLALSLKEQALNRGEAECFKPSPGQSYGLAQNAMNKSRNRQLQDLFPCGFAIHHAGMLRADRSLVERLFSEGHIRVLCCTATLAWGVNLPAHAVVIKGTDIYDAQKGSFVDLGILDVQQIFGRAGRPQFDTTGHGVIITSHSKLAHYLSLLTRQLPIESRFVTRLQDHLNAEIVLGTVTNIDEGVEWLRYTYLYVRAQLNPLVYGISHQQRAEDPQLYQWRRELIELYARKLDAVEMIRFNSKTGFFASTDIGRIASHYYINSDTVEVIVKGVPTAKLTEVMTDEQVINLVAHANEFEQLKIRDDELDELDSIVASGACRMYVAGGAENVYGKVNILVQAHISQHRINSFSLISDSAYVVQNAGRIVRALFEVALRNQWAQCAGACLRMAKSIDRRVWPVDTPLWQMTVLGNPPHVLERIDDKRLTIAKLREMDEREITAMTRGMGDKIKKGAWRLPLLTLKTRVRPITRTVIQIQVQAEADFSWDDKLHGKGTEAFWIWIEDPQDNVIYSHEYFMLHKKQVVTREAQSLSFMLPLHGGQLPSQYLIRCASDRWVGSETQDPITFHDVILPDERQAHTDLLNLQPLPTTVLNNAAMQSMYSFDYFNAVQTQIFHCLFHTDSNCLVGAPTGSGKTVAAEMAMFRVFNTQPKAKCVYIAPLKALVRERIKDWNKRLAPALGKKLVELTGDVTPDANAIATSDIIVTTPEKWDGISRSWQTRNYVKNVSLIIIDEIHLLGDDRGAVLETIVARTNFMAAVTERRVRVVGLSTALANAGDLGDWLAIQQCGLYNFRPSVRPVPTEVHIAGFAGKHYCPRMAAMNKPAFQAIKQHSPEKPALIFVSSRRQTRFTALDLIALLASEYNPRQWLHMQQQELDQLTNLVKDQNLKLTLAFGIGLHHAGLHESDRNLVEEMFLHQKIQVLVATATLAWGVNLPAHLVVIKGTEFYDGKTKRYQDFPVTDVLQMMGRAGRPQFDVNGVAMVFVQDLKKTYYRKFLYEPFPVESNLLKVLADHMNAEIVAGTVKTKQDAIDYLTWTYFFRRLIRNPTFYGLDYGDEDNATAINRFLTCIVDRALNELHQSGCVQFIEDGRTLEPQFLGHIASYYYLHNSTVRMFKERLSPVSDRNELLKILTDVPEYAEIPVRHNEDQVNSVLAQSCPIEVDKFTMDSSHTKTHLLLQAHFGRVPLPSTDYLTDLKSVMDQAIRILQAMLDVCAEQGWLVSSLRVIQLLQMVVQARWDTDPPLATLPGIQPHTARGFRRYNCETIPELQALARQRRPGLMKTLTGDGFLDASQVTQIEKALVLLPMLRVDLSVKGWWEGSLADEKRRVQISEHDAKYMQLHADQEYILNVDLTRLNPKKESRAYAPRFPKVKDEGWILVLGDIEQQEVIALKRVGFVRGRNSANLVFNTPSYDAAQNDDQRIVYTLFVISDCYIGLDMQYDINIHLLPVSLQAQVNMEVEM